MFSNALQNEKTQLSSLYGAIGGLAELGSEVIKVFIVPRLKFISDRIEPHLQGTGASNTDKIAAGHIRSMLQKSCAPVLKTIRNPPDNVDDYKRDYGFIGIALQQAVSKARNAPPPPLSTDKCSSSMTSASTAINSIASASINRPQIIPRISYVYKL